MYAVEPISSNFEMLCRNCELNQASNVSAERLAVAGENGTAEMSVNGVTSSLHWAENGVSKETVATVTLEEFLDSRQIDHVDYMKMDCEGAEWEILLRSPRVVLSRIKHLEMEYHAVSTDDDPGVLVQHLQSTGFDRVSSSGNSSTGIIVASRTRCD